MLLSGAQNQFVALAPPSNTSTASLLSVSVKSHEASAASIYVLHGRIAPCIVDSAPIQAALALRMRDGELQATFRSIRVCELTKKMFNHGDSASEPEEQTE